MYEFCDTTETPKVNPLPSEAVSFNGVWLDSEVPGFRTLSVEGREFVARNIDTYTVGNTDGAYYRGASFGGRTITVQYQICTDNAYNFREAFNKLNSLLRFTQVQLIFADEPDKYYIATRATYGNVPTGRNSVVGTIAFFCSDPKKYAVKEKIIDAYAESGEVLVSIRNNGNMPAPVSYDIVCDSDNGYVGIENGESYIRFGNPEEEDGDVVDVSQKLVKWEMLTSAKSNPTGGDGTDVMVATTVNGKEWVGRLNPSSGSGWHGAYRAITIPSDKNGVAGAKNFHLHTRHWFQCAFTSQKSRQIINLIGDGGKVVCGINITKSNTSNAKSTFSHIVNGAVKKTFDFECGADSKTNPFLEANGFNSIRKEGGTLQMFFFGKYYTYYDEELEDVAVKTIQFMTYNYGSAAMTRNYIGDMYMYKTDVADWNDVSNRYGAGTKITVSGEDGKLYVDGIPRLGDEMKGSEYFHAEPGQNSVSVKCSEWATGITVKARIREAWI